MVDSDRQMERSISRSLGASCERGPGVVAVLQRHGLGMDSLEASARLASAMAPEANRMMIERVPANIAEELLEALGSSSTGVASVMLAVCRDLSVPSIIGWDATDQDLVTKLYLNLSDSAVDVRATAMREVAPQATDVVAAPHVIGVNLTGSSIVLKAYEQSAGLHESAPDQLRRIAGAMELSGAVRCVELSKRGTPNRAWFVSPRPQCSIADLPTLPGLDGDALERVSPFQPGPVTSIGLAADERTWTVYYKAPGAPSPSWSLEPDVCVTADDVELGIFVEPVTAERAYQRTASSALSYRIRRGRPDGAAVDAVMAWAVARVIEAETAGGPLEFTSPPEPWRVI